MKSRLNNKTKEFGVDVYIVQFLAHWSKLKTTRLKNASYAMIDVFSNDKVKA